MVARIWLGAYFAAIAALLVALLHYHWQIIVTIVPLDLYESAMPVITGIIADGHNPYTRAFQPQSADVYPPLYNLLVAPLSWVFGNTFALHRVVSGFFLMLASVLCGYATWSRCRSFAPALATGVLMYAALLFYATPVSSTNALGVALFLAGLIVPWLCRFSVGSSLFGLLCGLLAFYTKQYFMLGIATLCLYMFLYVSMKRAILLGAAFAFVLSTSLIVVHKSSPYYLDNTLFAPAAAIHGLQSWGFLWMQLKFFALIYAGLLLAMLVCAISQIAQPGEHRPKARLVGSFRPGLSGWDGPLLQKRTGYFCFCLFWSSLVIVFWLGKNPGNYMTYFFQLMSPFLLILGFSMIGKCSTRQWLILPLVLFSFYKAYDILPKDFSYDAESWQKIDRLIAGSDEVLATQMLGMTLMQNNKAVYQNGHTFYFPLATNKPDWLLKDREEDRVASVWNEYITGLYRKIERQEFDLVLVSSWEMLGIFSRNPPPFEDVSGKEFLSRYYAVDEKIKLSMTDRYGGGTYTILVWRPRDQGPGL